MGRIYETQFPEGTRAIRVGDVDVTILGPLDGKVIVEADQTLAAQQQWLRRPDLEKLRRDAMRLEAAEREAAERRAQEEAAAREKADADRQASLAAAAESGAEIPTIVSTTPQVDAENSPTVVAEPAPAGNKRGKSR